MFELLFKNERIEAVLSVKGMNKSLTQINSHWIKTQPQENLTCLPMRLFSIAEQDILEAKTYLTLIIAQKEWEPIENWESQTKRNVDIDSYAYRQEYKTTEYLQTPIPNPNVRKALNAPI
jgi:hypothetical protein